MCAVALLGATAFGFGWRARNGRMRPAAGRSAPVPAAPVPAAAVPAGLAQPGQAPQSQAVADPADAGPSQADPATADQAQVSAAGPAQAAQLGERPPGSLPISSAQGAQARLRPARLKAGGSALSEADLGAMLGSRATLVQFSTAFCSPCRATRRILTEVADLVDGVSHVEIDAESRLDLVRRLDVRRTPTTFVLDPAGQITHRASGQPRKADVIAALGAVL